MPVIVNAILNEHQIIVDIVAFVNRGDFPRSRLGEKQRGKILAGWVSRKMRTMAQFAIKDMDADLGGPPGQPDAPGEPPRASMGSLRSPLGPNASSSLRNMEPAPQILEQRELEDMHIGHAGPPPGPGPGAGYYPYQQPAPLTVAPSPTVAVMGGAVEMPAEEHERVFGVPDAPTNRDADPDVTPTKPAANRVSIAPPPHGFDLPDFDHFGDDDSPPPVGPKPPGTSGLPRVPAQRTLPSQQRLSQVYQAPPADRPQAQTPPQPALRLPGVDGRESMDDWSPAPGRTDGEPTEEDWTRDAIMHMNLAGDLQRREG